MIRDVGGLTAEPHSHLLKLCLMGNAFVGKSCLWRRFWENAYVPYNYSSISVDFCTSRWKCRDASRYTSKGGAPVESVKVQLWDTSGQEKFKNVSRYFYRNTDVFLLVFAIDDAPSFDAITAVWLPSINQYGDELSRCILIGAKSDLDDEGKRQVSVQQARDLATTLGCRYIEVSAKAGYNVEKMINYAFSMALEVNIDRLNAAKALPRIVPLCRNVDPAPAPVSWLVRMQNSWDWLKSWWK